ncbi:aldehyde dehydrogenase [Salmonella enterica subsp. arizonae]|uniref:Aldehyde dehydrogenase n=1 Tax=Salmonella enterica subsp. arizonae TaxID=59203 RepID=A0A2X4TQG7_SALER|nr:aldehyde dehydrogenase [Salmonella enterica subsp. arizonae]
MNQQDIEQVVKAVLLKMQDSSKPTSTVHEMGVFASLDDAVAAAKLAQQGLKSVAMRQLAIQAIREAGEKHARELAELAVSETGMGRVDDKFAKNVAQARGTPGVECLSPQVLTGDNGLTLIENAPWGVVASVTPSTNPAATVINNAISLIAAGNSVVFAPASGSEKGLSAGNHPAQSGGSRRQRPGKSAGHCGEPGYRNRPAAVQVPRYWPAGGDWRRSGGGRGAQTY